MPSVKRRRSIHTDKRAALSKRLREIQAEIVRLRRERATVKRDEFLEMTKSLRQVEKNANDLAIQFMRIAQIQADVDAIKRALIKANLFD